MGTLLRKVKAVKRRAPKRRRASVVKLAREVKQFKQLMKPEKKITRVNVFGQNFGQLNSTGGGYLTIDLTPNPTQGLTENSKIGSSFSITSFNMNCQIIPQANNSVGGWVYWEIYKVIGNPAPYVYNTNPTGTLENPMELMYDVNPFVTGTTDAVIDLCSQKNPDFRSPFQLIRRGRVYMPEKGDVTNPTSRIRTFRIGHIFKKPHEMVYSKNTTTLVKGAFFLALRSNVGNISATASTCGNCASTGAFTGWSFSMAMNQFYIDL